MVYNRPMIDLGKTQELTVVSIKSHGAYLGESVDAGADARILLPAKEVPEGTAQGDQVEVFVYRDSSDRLIATTARPLAEVGQAAVMRVGAVTKIGAFLKWGLPKELLLPFAEQTAKVREGEDVLAALYVDRSGRLAATMKVYPYLRTDSPYIPGATVSGRIYQITSGHGAYAAVDDLYSGMIPERELPPDVKVGDVCRLRVTQVKEDGKLDLALREKAYLQMEEDAELIFARMEEDYSGVLPFDDHADPEKIREVFGLSKAAFKRAVGRLYKEHRVELCDGQIRILSGE